MTTLQDTLEGISWRSMLEDADPACYHSIRFNLSRFYDARPEECFAKPYIKALLEACNFQLDPNSTNTPLTLAANNYEFRSREPHEFSDEECCQLEKWLEFMEPYPLIIARICDLLWVRKHGPEAHKYARLSLAAYTQLSLIDSPAHDVFQGWHRAWVLASQLRDYEQEKRISESLTEAFESSCKTVIDTPMLPAKIGDIFHSKSGEATTQLANEYVRVGLTLKDQAQHHIAAGYFNRAARIYTQRNDLEQLAKTLAEEAEAYTAIAEGFEDRQPGMGRGEFSKAQSCYKKIPQTYRERHKAQENIKELAQRIRNSEQKLLATLAHVQSEKIDITEECEAARRHIQKAQSWHSALLHLAGVFPLVENNERDLALQGTLLSDLFFSPLYLHYDGRKIPSKNSVIKDKLGFECWIDMAVQAAIIPALHEACSLYRVPRKAFELLCEHSGLIDHNRSHLVGLGLYLGYDLDFAGAIHILAPQIEHIVRQLLNEQGVETRTPGKEADTYQEVGLTSLLERTEASAVLGEGLHFNLQAVFCDPLGGNLRNDCAHGLLNDQQAANQYSIYAWWLCLRLVVSGRLILPKHNCEASEKPLYSS